MKIASWEVIIKLNIDGRNATNTGRLALWLFCLPIVAGLRITLFSLKAINKGEGKSKEKIKKNGGRIEKEKRLKKFDRKSDA